MDENRIYRLWKSREIVVGFLKKRGYNIDEMRMTQEEFMSYAEENGYMNKVQKMTLKRGGLKVYWPAEQKLGGPEQRVISNDMESEGIHRAIIVIEDSVTSHAKSIHRLLRARGAFIDVFTISQTQTDPSDHELVPEHSICSAIEKKKILDEHNSKPHQFPGIRQNDIQIKILGAIRGQMIKIVNDSSTTPGYPVISYRIVTIGK